MKKIMKLNIAICDDNKLVLENEKALIEETLKEMGIPYKMDKYQNPENLIKNAWQYDLVFLDVKWMKSTELWRRKVFTISTRNVCCFS